MTGGRSTHYDTLGVHPRATADEVRTAYRRAAREAHPDRHGEASSARMAAVNEAWGVLGDASRRQRYDRELAEMGRGSYGASLGSDVGPGPGVAERRMPQPPVVVPTGDLSRFPWKFFTAIGVVAIVVVLIGSLLGDEPPPVEPDNFLVQGDCVTIGAGAGELTEVACSGGHDAKVQVVLNFGEQCPTGTEQYRDPQGRGEACVLRVPA